VVPPPRSASAAAREAALVEGVGRLTVELGSLEAALACLRVDRGLVETAIDLAYGSSLRHPERLASFARYLPPSARKAAEGPTNHVMALAIAYDLTWPTPESARVSSGFGPRIHPVLGKRTWHGGTDIAVKRGTPIRAMADGFVKYCKRDYVNGKFVKLDHGYGLTSAYVHNSRLLVRKGETVTKGQVIALSGETGRATGPHLHFQVEIDNRPVDPETFRERKAPRAHPRSIEAEAIGDADLPR
jgi:murein DD-endopeptidase MepM/ murein hydrolase activator NlpD